MPSPDNLRGPEADEQARACNRGGIALAQQGRFDEAVASFQQALQLRPDYIDAHNNLGNVLMFQGRLEEAVSSYQRALQRLPADSVSYRAGLFSHLCNALRQQGKLNEALAYGRRALELQPDFAKAHNNLGNVLQEQGRLDEAEACYRRALMLDPNYVDAHYNLALAARDQGKLADSIACSRRALELKPDYAEAHNILGLALHQQGRLEESLACYRRALELKPDYADAHSSLGTAFHDQGRIAEALACFQRAIELRPQFALAHFNRSLLRLLTGDFAHGWAEYEWRWQTGLKPFSPRSFPRPLWDGRPLQGRTLLLHAEQGLGDTIQFLRYAALVRQPGARVVVECPTPLLRIVRTCRFIDQLADETTSALDFDLYYPLMSLPGLLKTTLASVPADVPYLFAAPDLVAPWRESLGGLEGFKIGIVWRGGPAHPNDRARSIPLSCFEPLAALPGVRLFSLQKGAGAEQLQDVAGRFPITELGSRLEDFMDTAAVLASLDLLITADTAIAHLAGALALPVWVALPLVPDWRWLLDRSDSPWYPTMRLFRQKAPGDWRGVFDEIKTALLAKQGLRS